MSNYIGADIRRVLHKQSFLWALGLFAALFAAVVFIYWNPGFTADMYVAKISSFLSFFPLVVGLVTFLSVYADDFQCRSMQVAIGYGIPREKIVLGKLLESAMLLLGTAAGMGVFMLAAPLILGLAPNAQHMQTLLFTILAEMLRSLGYAAISTIPVFFSQNAASGMILYVLLASKTVYIVLSMVLGQTVVISLVGDLTQYLYTTQLYTAKTLLVENQALDASLILAVIGYVAIPTVISVVSFRKKELEF